jgi:nitroreductase/dihydropteridine reductase
MSFLDNLQWRFATKEFDENKKVNSEDLEKIAEAIRLAPTSYGLQPFHVYVVANEKIKTSLKLKSFLQKQIDTSSHLLIFCAITKKSNLYQRIDDYVTLIESNNTANQSNLDPLRLRLKNIIKAMSQEELDTWTQKQSYLPLGFALAACAELKIDSCPLEGFEKKSIDKILELPSGLKSTVILAMGYRKEEPKLKKIRFSKKDLFTEL